MSFDDPGMLLLAIPVALVFWMKSRRKRRASVLFSSIEGLRQLPKTGMQRVKAFLPALQLVALVALVVAASRPGVLRVRRNAYSEGLAIQMVLDRSGSMSSTDLDEDPLDRRVQRRLDVVKDVIRDFVDTEEDVEAMGGRLENHLPGRPDDLIGLTVFAGYVKTVCPTTLDHWALLRTLAAVDVQEAVFMDPEASQTAIGDALTVAVARLEQIPSKSRVAILLSDGINNIGNVEPLQAAEVAVTKGVKVYTIGVGSKGMDFDEDTLKQIAERTGGAYFSARDANQLREIYASIDELEKTENPAFQRSDLMDRFHAWAIVALSLFLLHTLLVSTRFRSLP